MGSIEKIVANPIRQDMMSSKVQGLLVDFLVLLERIPEYVDLKTIPLMMEHTLHKCYHLTATGLILPNLYYERSFCRD